MEAFLGAFSGVWFALFIIIFAACGTFTASVGNMFWSLIVLAAGMALSPMCTKTAPSLN